MIGRTPRHLSTPEHKAEQENHPQPTRASLRWRGILYGALGIGVMVPGALLVKDTHAQTARENSYTVPSDTCDEIDPSLTDLNDVVKDQIMYDACKLVQFWRQKYPDLNDITISNQGRTRYEDGEITIDPLLEYGLVKLYMASIGASDEPMTIEAIREQVRLALAHEAGHYIAAQTGTTPDDTLTAELQATCDAGVFLAGVDVNGRPGVPLDELQRARNMTAFSPTDDTKSDHGTSTEKEEAFLKGVRDGKDACNKVYA